MKRFDIPLHGLAAPGTRILCETPLQEVWHQNRRYGTPEYCDYYYADAAPPPNLDSLKRYVVTRVQQALEFREPTRGATVLTSPLFVYYSLLNLIRAMLALHMQKECDPSHGLSVTGNCSELAKVFGELRKKGTLPQLLQVHDVGLEPGKLGFLELLQSIPELRSSLAVPGHSSHVSVVWVTATIRGDVSLQFPNHALTAEEFEASWSDRYPSLAARFEHADSYTLRARDGELPLDDDPNKFAASVGQFCDEHLEVNLIDPTRWYIVSSESPYVRWPREARYLAAMYMLSHVVRYEPELLRQEWAANSYLHAVVESLIRMSDRYVPQMILGWTGTNHFFG